MRYYINGIRSSREGYKVLMREVRMGRAIITRINRSQNGSIMVKYVD